jgi:hypothetical protein
MLSFQPISISMGASTFLGVGVIHHEDFQQRYSYSTLLGYGQMGPYKASFQRDDFYDVKNAYAYSVDKQGG